MEGKRTYLLEAGRCDVASDRRSKTLDEGSVLLQRGVERAGK